MVRGRRVTGCKQGQCDVAGNEVFADDTYLVLNPAPTPTLTPTLTCIYMCGPGIDTVWRRQLLPWWRRV